MVAKIAQVPIHIMAKPTGPVCNLGCKYCFFLKKDKLYPGSHFRMTDEVMESYVRQMMEAHSGQEVIIAWQGGEPTLIGLDFFRRTIDMEQRHLGSVSSVLNTIQTNGTLLDDEWCGFLKKNGFLVGLSLDGPKAMHDAFRMDKLGNSTFQAVMKAVRLMQKHGVEFNILCTINAANGDYPVEVYRFLRDEVGAGFIQFIPVVERDNETGNQEGNEVTDRSVGPEQFGKFLIGVFDEWIKQDVGSVFVNYFDSSLASWVMGESSLCILRASCGTALVLEHNGDLYSCDHFVEPGFLLGNITVTPLAELARSSRQREFGGSKSATLPRYCRQCEFMFTCHGECPKNRFLTTPDGEPGLNYLCAGYKAFFDHIKRPIGLMADLLLSGRMADDAMAILARQDDKPRSARVSRNALCPCGSQLKYKKCHGRG